MLGWTPRTFWTSTTDEFLAALDGWRRAHGHEDEAGPLTTAELNDLMARFPDHG